MIFYLDLHPVRKSQINVGKTNRISTMEPLEESCWNRRGFGQSIKNRDPGQGLAQGSVSSIFFASTGHPQRGETLPVKSKHRQFEGLDIALI